MDMAKKRLIDIGFNLVLVFPELDLNLVHAQVDLDVPKFSRMFVDLMSASTPHPAKPQP